MNFVTFFSYEGKLPRLELELLQTFQQSLYTQYSHARLVILTDLASAPQFKALGFEPFAIPVTRDTLLLDRIRGFRAFLETLADGASCAMLDFDMLVMKPFDFLDQDFEVAYTVRRHLNKQPLNGGVAIYRATCAAKRILDKVIEDYKCLPPEQQQWWGDQISISNLFREKLGDLTEGMHFFDGASVLLLDGKKYNFTPYDMDVSPKTLARNFIIDGPLAQWLDEAIDDKFILHFKGPRKHLQFQVNWQINHPSEHYRDYLGGVFLQNIGLFRRESIQSIVEQLARDFPSCVVTDLLVLLVLNYKKLAIDAREETISEIVQHLKSYGDFRYKILGNVAYQTQTL